MVNSTIRFFCRGEGISDMERRIEVVSVNINILNRLSTVIETQKEAVDLISDSIDLIAQLPVLNCGAALCIEKLFGWKEFVKSDSTAENKVIFALNILNDPHSYEVLRDLRDHFKTNTDSLTL